MPENFEELYGGVVVQNESTKSKLCDALAKLEIATAALLNIHKITASWAIRELADSALKQIREETKADLG